MKTQLSKPSRSKARYTEEYKQEALELWRNSGRSAAKVAAELGIRAPLLYRWARPKRQSNSSASESKSKRSVEELEAEIRRLQAENAKLLEQREVLKNRWASSAISAFAKSRTAFRPKSSHVTLPQSNAGPRGNCDHFHFRTDSLASS